MNHRLVVIALVGLVLVTHSRAQGTGGAVTLTLYEAIQLALANNYALQIARLETEGADSQVLSAISAALPDITASSGYTRNLKEANPFVGSAAGNLFSGFDALGWLRYNEVARTDMDPSTVPIGLDEYFFRQRAGLAAAGIVPQPSDDNPFAVANQFHNIVSFTQPILAAATVKGLKAALLLREVEEQRFERQKQVVVDVARRAFYRTLLAQEQSAVAVQSVARTRRTLEETYTRVSEGVAPKAVRLSTEVQLANLETRAAQLQNQALDAMDNLKFTIGMPITQPVRLVGSLDVKEIGVYLTVSKEEAFRDALSRRPDMEQARIMYEFRETALRAAELNRLPRINAVANLSYTGRVPDARTFVISDPDNPFSFSTGHNDFLSRSYWQTAVNVGLTLSWTIFDGFAQSAARQNLQMEISRARLQLLQLRQSVQMEIATALRNLESAREQIMRQDRNVENAELNYSFAKARLTEGVATPLEERNASDQLDQSRINYIQAVHDFLVARSAYETAVGIVLPSQTEFRMTSAETYPDN